MHNCASVIILCARWQHCIFIVFNSTFNSSAYGYTIAALLVTYFPWRFSIILCTCFLFHFDQSVGRSWAHCCSIADSFFCYDCIRFTFWRYVIDGLSLRITDKKRNYSEALLTQHIFFWLFMILGSSWTIFSTMSEVQVWTRLMLCVKFHATF